jgi:hypothetical protein
VDEGAPPLGQPLRVDLADRQEQTQLGMDGEKVPQVARFPGARLHAVEGDGDDAATTDLGRDLVDGRASDQVVVASGDPEASEPSRECRPEALFHRGVEHRACDAVEYPRREGALPPVGGAPEHAEGSVSDEDAVETGEGGRHARQTGEARGVPGLDDVVDLGAGALPEEHDTADRRAASAPAHPRRIGAAAVDTGPSHRESPTRRVHSPTHAISWEGAVDTNILRVEDHVMSFRVQVVLPDEILAIVDEHADRLSRLYPGTTASRSSVLRQWIDFAAPHMDQALREMEEAYRRPRAPLPPVQHSPVKQGRPHTRTATPKPAPKKRGR